MIRRVQAASLAFVVAAAGGWLKAEAKKAEVSSLKPGELRNFEKNPPKIQAYLEYALGLTEKNLGYRYGSCDPKNGGMDCSGTVQHILKHNGYRAPRQSNLIYLWVRKHGNLRAVKNAKSLSDEQLSYLQPGDLLFWEGTYDVGERFPPTSHVMIYLGKRKSDGKPVMVGASSGRYYSGKARHGVSVFDFKLPRKESKARFVGYGPVPGVKSLNRFLPPLTKPQSKPKPAAAEKIPVAPVVKEKMVFTVAPKTDSGTPETPDGEREEESKPSKPSETSSSTTSTPPPSSSRKFKPGEALKKRPLFKNLFKRLGNQ